MIDVLFAMIAATANAVGADQPAATATASVDVPAISVPAVPIPVLPVPVVPAPAAEAPAPIAPLPAPSSVAVGQGVVIGANTLLEGVQSESAPAPQAAEPVALAQPDAAALNMAVVPSGLVAEPQTPSGKFTTATEVKPILNATKGSWIGVRKYEGSDLLYVTHLWGWRCGLSAMAISINDEPMQNWPLPACHMEYATPNAIGAEDGLPFLKLKLGSVQTVTIQIIYDDLTGDVARFERANVLIP